MAHQLESLFLHRNPAWHGLGTILDNQPTSEEALVAAGLNWNVIQSDVFTADGVVVPGYKANIRDTDKKVLGIVTDRYKVVQNKEAFSFVDHLLGEGVQFESAGSLFGGRKVWMLAILPNKYKVVNDTIAPYLCFVNTHDGSGAIRIVLTPTRVVCNNTLNIALHDAQRSWSCVHLGNIETKLNEARKTLLLAENYMEKFVMEAERLHNKMFYKNDVEAFLEELIPIPDEAGAVKEANIIGMREDIKTRFYSAPDLRKLENSAWKMLNAVSDFAIHAEPLRKTSTYSENNFDRVLNGHPLIDQAYEIINSMIEGVVI
jgi:phage/plasmid-like protein (TIGR03299 family)